MAIKKLADIKKKVEEKTGFSGGDGESPFLSLKDGDSVKLRFLQEWDDDSELYDERRGAIYYYEEHSSPKDFKISAVCTAEDEGRCWACEQTSNPEIGRKWRPKLRFMANVIVRGADGAPDKVKILKRGFSDKDIGNALVGIAEEFGTLGGQDIKLTRKGGGMNDTSYIVLPLAPKPMTKEDQALEVIDVRKFAKHVPYDQQSDFYSGATKEGSKAESWLG
jgi:hypothetical protein